MASSYLGRQHLPDDDHTFAPPPLSAYSIALLNDQKSSPKMTGIDTLRLKENPELRNTLKNKLSVHFQNSDRSAYSDRSDRSDPLGSNGHANTGNTSFSNQNSSSHNLSSHSIHNGEGSGSAANASSYNMSSHNLSIHSTSGHSMNQNTSNTSFSSSSNTQQEDEHMDFSGENLAKSPHTSATTASAPASLAPVMTRPHSNGYSGVKRSRLARRFKTLGPPKRASEVAEPADLLDMQEQLEESNQKQTSILNDSPVQTPRTKRELSVSPAQNPLPAPKPTSSVTSNSDFFKTLEKLKMRSRSELLRSSQESERASSSTLSTRSFEVARSTTDSSHAESQPGAFQSSERNPVRRPLHTISPQRLNIDRGFGDFRKPHTPKTMGDQTPAAPSKREVFPAQAVFETNATPIHSLINDSIQEEAKRRKLINVNSQQYEKLELLGRGGTSKVYKVRSLSTKLIYALKKVSFDKFDESCVKGFKGEIDLLNKLKEESRVVKLIDHTVSDGSIFLVMECGDLDLARVLQTKLNLEKKLDFNFVKFHAMEILKCVEAVHRAGIVHSDLKPANFLFVKGVMKIIDFGIANAVPDHTANIYRESQIGTPNYMAPEALVEVNHTLSFSSKSSAAGNTWKVGKPSDIWSCGCIIYQMIYGRPPYGSYSGQLRIMAIMNPQVKIEYPSRGVGGIPVPLSSIELMQKCLTRNPNERWTVEQCMNSDFLRPRAVSRAFVEDLVYSAVNFGCHNKENVINDDIYEKLVETVLHQIEDLNYA